MGGSGGRSGGYIPASSDALRKKIEEAQRKERERLDGEVNDFLREELALYNQRDAQETKQRLEGISDALMDKFNLEHILFGGSVAKHTYVDGLSDVDALVILDRGDTRGLSASKMLDDLWKHLTTHLSRRDIGSIDKGTMAVTVTYKDGLRLQLLPAIRTGDVIKIPDAKGSGWNETEPKVFQRKLSSQNEKLNWTLVPTIKLVKSLVSDLPEQQRLSGYHIEALALDGAAKYKGPVTPKAVLLHVLEHAAERARRPIADVTGQSRTVDADLGAANSTRRILVSQAVAGISRRLNAATSINQWKAMFGRSEK